MFTSEWLAHEKTDAYKFLVQEIKYTCVFQQSVREVFSFFENQ